MTVLVVAAFWAEEGDSDELQPLVDRCIKGSGSVVTFTREQARQPGLLYGLRRYKLTEAGEWDEQS